MDNLGYPAVIKAIGKDAWRFHFKAEDFGPYYRCMHEDPNPAKRVAGTNLLKTLTKIFGPDKAMADWPYERFAELPRVEFERIWKHFCATADNAELSGPDLDRLFGQEEAPNTTTSTTTESRPIPAVKRDDKDFLDMFTRDATTNTWGLNFNQSTVPNVVRAFRRSLAKGGETERVAKSMMQDLVVQLLPNPDPAYAHADFAKVPDEMLTDILMKIADETVVYKMSGSKRQNKP